MRKAYSPPPRKQVKPVTNPAREPDKREHLWCSDCDWVGQKARLVLGSPDATDLRCPECGCAALEPIHPAKAELWNQLR